MTISIGTDDLWIHTLANEAIFDSYQQLENLADDELPTQEQANLAGERILHYMEMPYVSRKSNREAYSIVEFIQDEIGAKKIHVKDGQYITTEELLEELRKSE
jgi:hypothetical protein